MTLGKNVERIDGLAFADTAIKEIQLPESVRYIECHAFKECKSLESVKIGFDEIFIEKGAFDGTPYVAGGYGSAYESFEREREKYFKFQWDNFSHTAKLLKLMPEYKALKRIFVPQRIESIGTHAFEGSEAEEIVLSDGVNKIGAHVFDECRKLSVLRIGKNVKTVGEQNLSRHIQIEIDDENPNKNKILQKFNEKDGGTDKSKPLQKTDEKAEIPDKSAPIQKPNEKDEGTDKSKPIPKSDEKAELTDKSTPIQKPNENGKSQQSAASNDVKKINAVSEPSIKKTEPLLPEGVTEIKAGQFKGNMFIEELVIPNGVKSIGEGAFKECTRLKSVTIPSSVTGIGSLAFCQCRELTEINFNAESCADLSKTGNVFDYAGTRGDGIKVIFGDSVKKIPAYLFHDCPKLRSVTVGKNVTSIDDSAFAGCKELKSITIPDNVTNIDGFAFADCTGLTSIAFGRGVTSIGRGAFFSCIRLTGVSLPSGVTSIGDGAFNSCAGLKSVNIPDSVESIGEGAFYACTELTSVTIGAGVRKIDAKAFADCPKLETINYRGTKKQWKDVELAKNWDGNKLIHKHVNFS